MIRQDDRRKDVMENSTTKASISRTACPKRKDVVQNNPENESAIKADGEGEGGEEPCEIHIKTLWLY